MNALRTFNHEMFGQVRTMTNDRGETFFVGKDVAEALGYKNTADAIINPKSRNITINRFQVAGTSSVLSLS